MPAACSDRPGSQTVRTRPRRSRPSNQCDRQRRRRTTSCLVLHPVGFAEPDRSPGLLVRSYRTVSPLPPGSDSNEAKGPTPTGQWQRSHRFDPATPSLCLLSSSPSAPRSAVYFLLHFPYPRGRWALPTTVSYGARTFLCSQPTRGWSDRRSAAAAQPTPVLLHCMQTESLLPGPDRASLTIRCELAT